MEYSRVFHSCRKHQYRSRFHWSCISFKRTQMLMLSLVCKHKSIHASGYVWVQLYKDGNFEPIALRVSQRRPRVSFGRELLADLVQLLPRLRLARASKPKAAPAHPACISAWGGHYTIQAVAFDFLIAFSLFFPLHTRLALYHHSSCNK
jgi:hypothetical protein